MRFYTTLPASPLPFVFDFFGLFTDEEPESLLHLVPHHHLEAVDLIQVPVERGSTFTRSMTKEHCFSVVYRNQRGLFGRQKIVGIQLWSPGIYIKRFGFSVHRSFALIDLIKCMEHDPDLGFIWEKAERRKVMRYLEHHDFYVVLPE